MSIPFTLRFRRMTFSADYKLKHTTENGHRII